MSKQLIRTFLVVFILLLTLPLFAAETMKLRHVLSLYADSKDGGMSLPQGVACRGNVLIVSDSGNGRLLRFSIQDGAVKGGEEIRVPEVAYPTTTEISTKGEIFVFDGKQRRIARLAPDGTFKGFVRPEGLPAPQELVPMSFRLDSADNIYILDIFTERVVVLDPLGKYMRSFDLPAGSAFISDLEVDSRGNIFLLDPVNALVYSQTKEGKGFSVFTRSLKGTMNFSMNMTMDRRGVIYLADRNGGGIVIVGPDGSLQGRQLGFGWRDGLLRYPSQMCISEKDDLFITDRNNSRVQVFSLIK